VVRRPGRNTKSDAISCRIAGRGARRIQRLLAVNARTPWKSGQGNLVEEREDAARTHSTPYGLVGSLPGHPARFDGKSSSAKRRHPKAIPYSYRGARPSVNGKPVERKGSKAWPGFQTPAVLHPTPPHGRPIRGAIRRLLANFAPSAVGECSPTISRRSQELGYRRGVLHLGRAVRAGTRPPESDVVKQFAAEAVCGKNGRKRSAGDEDVRCGRKARPTYLDGPIRRGFRRRWIAAAA